MLVNSLFIIYNQVSMSIPNLIYKIKSKISIDKDAFMYLFIIVGVGIGCFGLGRISINNDINIKNDIAIKQEQNLLNIKNTKEPNPNINPQVQSQEKRYVASKNGKMYYSLGCSGAKRIKLENEVWFSTKSDAEKSGYTFASACK